MSYKKLIIIIVSLIISLLIAIVGLMLLYKFKPELIGLAPKNNNSKEKVEENKNKDKLLKADAKMNISLLEFNKMQSELIKSAILKYQNEDIQKQKNFLYDSLKNVSISMKPTRDSLVMLRDSFQISRTYINHLNDSLNKLSTLYNTALSDIKKTKSTIKDKTEKTKQEQIAKKTADSTKQYNLMNYAKIYNNSNPQEVALILDQLDEKDAAFIIKNMNKKKAAKVIEKMQPESAAAIMLLGS